MEGAQPTAEFWIDLLPFQVTSLHLSEPQFPNLQNRRKENCFMGHWGKVRLRPGSPGREALLECRTPLPPSLPPPRPTPLWDLGDLGGGRALCLSLQVGEDFLALPRICPLPQLHSGLAPSPPLKKNPEPQLLPVRPQVGETCPNAPSLWGLGLFAAPSTSEARSSLRFRLQMREPGVSMKTRVCPTPKPAPFAFPLFRVGCTPVEGSAHSPVHPAHRKQNRCSSGPACR